MKVSLGSLSIDGIRRMVGTAFEKIPKACYVSGNTSSSYVAGDAISLPHNLGETPVFFSVMTKGDFSVYIEEGDEKAWTDKKILVRCSDAGKKFVLLINGSL